MKLHGLRIQDVGHILAESRHDAVYPILDTLCHELKYLSERDVTFSDRECKIIWIVVFWTKKNRLISQTVFKKLFSFIVSDIPPTTLHHVRHR